MKRNARKLDEQVVVVTGATSGIGLATIRAAAARGAKVVLTARNEEDLARLQAELEAKGHAALAIGADVADPQALSDVRDAAIARFGRIDTWVNNAGVSIYGKLRELDLVEARRLFDVNFWGVVNGCRAAIPALGESGGTIVNVGSVASDRVLPTQGLYAASKHAVKGYTDALRMELEMEGLPITVTLVKPSAIDTPHTEHAKNHLGHEPKPPPFVYAPEAVADAILFCAEHPRRDVIVGMSGKVLSVLEKIAPRVTDKLLERTVDGLHKPDRRTAIQRARDEEDASDSLFMAPLFEGRTRGGRPGHVLERSVYTSLALRPPLVFAALAGVVALAFGLLARRR